MGIVDRSCIVLFTPTFLSKISYFVLARRDKYLPNCLTKKFDLSIVGFWVERFYSQLLRNAKTKNFEKSKKEDVSSKGTDRLPDYVTKLPVLNAKSMVSHKFRTVLNVALNMNEHSRQPKASSLISAKILDEETHKNEIAHS